MATRQIIQTFHFEVDAALTRVRPGRGALLDFKPLTICVSHLSPHPWAQHPTTILLSLRCLDLPAAYMTAKTDAICSDAGRGASHSRDLPSPTCWSKLQHCKDGTRLTC